MGTFGPERWAVTHVGNELVLNEGLPTKEASWDDREQTEIYTVSQKNWDPIKSDCKLDSGSQN